MVIIMKIIISEKQEKIIKNYELINFIIDEILNQKNVCEYKEMGYYGWNKFFNDVINESIIKLDELSDDIDTKMSIFRFLTNDSEHIKKFYDKKIKKCKNGKG